MKSASFTLFLPSYNGGEYFKECVRSVLAQSYNDFELVVLDDCSSDGSLQWLATLDDARLTVCPSAQRLGIEKNWGRILSHPKRDYMTIIAQDDLLDSNYLQVMNDLVARHPEAGLYYAHFRFIDEKGATERACRSMPERETSAEYLAALFSGERDTHAAGYLWPSQRYETVGGIPLFKGLLFADDALWFKLMQGTYKATAAEECVAVRTHANSASHAPDWKSWLMGLEEYVPFLKQFVRDDTAFSEAYQRYAPEYFSMWCRNIYNLALMQSTQQNQPAKTTADEAFAAISDVLQRESPELLPAFKAMRKSRAIRLREFVHSHSLTRALYLFYLSKRPRKGQRNRVLDMMTLLKSAKNITRSVFGDPIEKMLEREIVGSCRTVLDVGCGSESPLRFFSHRLQHSVGVDAFAPAIEQSRGQNIHNEYFLLDVLQIGDKFGENAFDCVLACDLIEHLHKEDGERLIAMMEKIAAKKVILYTPNGFVPQSEYDGNAWQQHLSGWSVREMIGRGYRVLGMSGWKTLRGERGGARLKPLILGETLALLSQMWVRHRPQHAFQILCVKRIGKKRVS